MTQSTFLYQVANKLLMLLQGYSKTIRLLLVMFLTLTASTAWGAALTGNYTKITNISNLSAGDRVVLYADDISKGVTGWDGNKDATVSESGWVEYLVESASGGVYLKDENAGKYIASPGSSNQFKYGTKAVCTVNENGVLKCNSRFLVQNGTYYRMYSSIGSYKPFYVYKVSAATPSYDITVKSNNDAYGSVSISGKTITATPNAGYRVKSGDAGYTVTSGTAVVTNNGNNTFSVTPSSNCTITINFEAIPKYTVTLNAGPGTCAASVTESSAGAGVELPTPTLDCGDWEFAGWAEASVEETTTEPTLFKAGDNYKPISDCELYAVYQRTEETEGGGGTEVSKSYTFSQYTAGTQYADNEVHKLDDNVTLTTTNCHFTSELRIYSSSTYNGYVVSNKLPGRIISIGFNAGYKVDAIDVFGSTNGTDWTKVGQVSVTSTSYKDYTLDFGATNYTYFKLDVAGSNQVRLKSITIIWESTSAGGTITTTYYHSTPDCGTPTPTPTLSVDPTTLTFENTTTNTSTEKTFTLTGSALTANAALALSGTNAGMFSVSPTSVTPTAGSINQIVTITYKPTAIGNHTATLTISSTGAERKTVALSGTGVAKAANYTVKHYQQNILDDNYTLIETETPSGEINASVTPAVKTYEGFTAPATQTVTIAADGSTVVEYRYTRNSYTLAWEIDGGTITVEGTPAGQVKYGATLTAPIVTKDGFQFKGWNPSVPATMPAENVSYTAQWTQIYTITWNVSGDTELISPTTFAEGDAWDMPTTDYDCSGKGFVGWTTNPIIAAQDEAPDPLYTNASQFLNATATYYAVFAENTGGGGETTANLSIKDYAVANSWVNATQYTTVNIDENVTVTAEGEDNTGKYYENGKNWRLYQTENPTLTLTAKDGYTIKQITITYNVEKTGILTFGGSNISSGTACDINATSATFGVGNTGSATNGQVRISNISVTYSGSGGGYTDYSTSCGTYTVTFYGFNSGGCTTTCGENPAEIEVAQGATYTIPNCVPNDPAGLGRTFAGTWNTQANGKGTTYKPGESFTVDSDITLYAQWILKTTEDIVLPTDVVDLATTDIVVTGGTTLTLQAGTTTLNSLTLEGGRTTLGDYIMPSVYLEDWNGIELINDTIYFDLSVDMANYYPFAVPFPVAVNQVNYADPTLANASVYGKHYVIKRYDGANRANQGENKNANWVKVEDDETLEPGVGYIITAVPIGDEALIRFPMTITTPLKQTEQSVTVTAHTGTATDINNGGHQRHAGWNFIANPYLSRFAGQSVGDQSNLMIGSIVYVDGEGQTIGDVPYVTIPSPNFSKYEQVELAEAVLSPSYAFFVQAAQTATLSFATAGRQQYMPALRAAAVEPLRLPLMLTQATASDRTTLLVSDDYTANYEIGKDLEKMFGSAEQVSLYAWSSNTPLAYCAVPWASATQAIPLGYRTNKSGSVTIELSNTATGMNDVASVLLYDQVTGLTTDLLVNAYTFETEVGTHDARFTVMITPKQGATTGCEEVMLPTDGTYKFLRNGQLYINHCGTVYTVEGRENSRVR